MANNHPYRAERERWLADAIAILGDTLFKPKGYTLPKEIRVSPGWPLGTRPGKAIHSIGQCFNHVSSADNHFEVFISPELADSSRVLDVLVHELCHIVAGLDAGHGKGFGKVAKAVGLAGKMTATEAGDELKPVLATVIDSLGEYPHATLSSNRGGTDRKPKQGTRMVKLQCECGYTVRATQKWIDQGLPSCPNGHEMEVA